MSKAALFILDGWGLGQKPSADAIAQAHTPFMRQLMGEYPYSTLITFGEDVGLPEGQMGIFEVGHLNIGAGRVVWQELARINKAVRENELHTNPTLLAGFRNTPALLVARFTYGPRIHVVSHSHISHLLALCDMTHRSGPR